jgi:hypothetical protein
MLCYLLLRMSLHEGKKIFSRMLKHANLLQQCILGPRRSLADYVSSACGSRSAAADTRDHGRAAGDTPDDGHTGVDTSDHRGAGADNLNHPDPLRACRLPCALRDAPGKENCARRRRNGFGVTECLTISLRRNV